MSRVRARGPRQVYKGELMVIFGPICLGSRIGPAKTFCLVSFLRYIIPSIDRRTKVLHESKSDAISI